jgi:integrase
MPRFLSDMLTEHINTYPSPDGYVFTSSRGGPVRHHDFYVRQFRRAVRRAGIPAGLRFYDLRHTEASLLISRGANSCVRSVSCARDQPMDTSTGPSEEAA